MSETTIQYAFHTGEWAPALNARVDLQKYHTAVALAENFFVDYRGGLSSRMGTKYILQGYDSAHFIRLIPFQASFALGYFCEFGEHYVRFYINGAPVLESPTTITNVVLLNPVQVNVVNTYAAGDVVFITGIVGTTQLNGRYFKVIGGTGAFINLGDLNGVPINGAGMGAYVSGGTVRRVYQIVSPYASTDLPLLKYKLNVDRMVLNHPNFAPHELRLIASTNWTLAPIVFGTTISPPATVALATDLTPGLASYAYVVTAADSSGQESVPSASARLAALRDMRSVPMTMAIGWSTVAGADSYNVYKAEISLFGGVPVGAAYGYIGTATGNLFNDSNIEQDFSQTPPIARNPFGGSGVVSYNVTVEGTYTFYPEVHVAPPPSGSITFATAYAQLGVQGTPTVAAGGAGYAVNDTITMAYGVVLVVNTIAAGAITSFKAITVPPSQRGSLTGGTVPAQLGQLATSGGGTGAVANVAWGVTGVFPVSTGAGYSVAPAVTFSPVGASATAVLGPANAANPRVPAFFNQRLWQMGLNQAPQSFYASQPGLYYNFDITNPIQPSDSISGSLVAGQLGEIKSAVAMQSGMVVLTDTIAWLVNSGSTDAVTPINIVGNPNSYVGANDVPPIVANSDIIYVQSKGSVVRNINYDFYRNQFNGKDISVLSSHLFYGYTLTEMAWAEEPFKVAWVIRGDGKLLSLTYLPEQELIGWAHSQTEGGVFESICTVIETGVDGTKVDAVYVVVKRTVNGNIVRYIERMAERVFPQGRTDAWCVDAGLQYLGAPATTFSNAQHLAGLTVTGLADGDVIEPFVMPVNGTFTLPLAASKVVIGVGFECIMQTLGVELQPTVQGKDKKINSVNVRVKETLDIRIGMTLDTLVDMDDFFVGELNRQDNVVVTDLYTGNGLENVDPAWTVPGQYYIKQEKPYPVSILGVMPNITEGDEDARGD